ncbi:hypothetical protein AMECASPLE_000716 [Ameca splendens]|uniref:Uncharacterized protein n=1 Tax=Ameca splendens TaxID=208324 RepID=A0ABV0XAS0_9TELE
MNPQSHMKAICSLSQAATTDLHGLLCHCMELISWLVSVHIALLFLDGDPREDRAGITGELSSFSLLTTTLLAVMQLRGLLSVSTKGDSRSVQQPRGVTKSGLFFSD